ncbi:MAG TPA: GDP-mannose 4,6-dehydratase [Fervidobacterium nodosum]|mgnify:CR=1 FL=1|nr:GDP-mannose 4,6-dehydratase [Fervidobacterium nodosum]
MISSKKIFITGGAGFIGTKLSERLANDNKLILYDNLWRNSLKNSYIHNHPNVQLIQGDILDFENLNEILHEIKPDIVVHLAAIAGVDTVIKYPVKTLKINMIGTYNILEAIKDLKIERFLNFSTSEIFGSYAYKVDDNAQSSLATVGEARWTYSVSKLAGEHLSYAYYKEYGIPIVNIRPFNVYGPGQVGEGAIHRFVIRALKNEDLEIHGDGDQIRSWCYIDDFIEGVILCLEKEEAIGQAFNIGNPKGTTTISMLAKLIKEISGSNSKIIYVPKTYVDVELRIPSIDKAKTILGYNPKIELEEGIKRTIEW